VSASKEAKEAARRAKAAERERERVAKAAERERIKELKKIAREALVRDARRKQKRPQEFDISGQDPPAPRVPDPWLEPEAVAAAAEAAVKRRKGPKAKAKPKAQPKVKAQSKSPAIRRVPVDRERSPKRAGPKRAPRRASAVGKGAGTENIQAQ
jgi:hypothetical protein